VFKVRKEIDSRKFPGPHVIAAGQQLVKKSPGAYMAPSFLEYDGADDAREQAPHSVSLGADLIKVRLTSQRALPSSEELRAIVAEAHRLSRRVAARTDVPANEAVEGCLRQAISARTRPRVRYPLLGHSPPLWPKRAADGIAGLHSECGQRGTSWTSRLSRPIRWAMIDSDVEGRTRAQRAVGYLGDPDFLSIVLSLCGRHANLQSREDSGKHDRTCFLAGTLCHPGLVVRWRRDLFRSPEKTGTSHRHVVGFCG